MVMILTPKQEKAVGKSEQSEKPEQPQKVAKVAEAVQAENQQKTE